VTKFLDKTFTVPAPGTEAYRSGWDRVFGGHGADVSGRRDQSEPWGCLACEEPWCVRCSQHAWECACPPEGAG
jgi:hypothetical protein